MRRRDGIVVRCLQLLFHLLADGVEPLLAGRAGLLVDVVGYDLLAREGGHESDLCAQDTGTKYCYVIECHGRHTTPVFATTGRFSCDIHIRSARATGTKPLLARRPNST